MRYLTYVVLMIGLAACESSPSLEEIRASKARAYAAAGYGSMSATEEMTKRVCSEEFTSNLQEAYGLASYSLTTRVHCARHGYISNPPQSMAWWQVEFSLDHLAKNPRLQDNPAIIKRFLYVRGRRADGEKWARRVSLDDDTLGQHNRLVLDMVQPGPKFITKPAFALDSAIVCYEEKTEGLMLGGRPVDTGVRCWTENPMTSFPSVIKFSRSYMKDEGGFDLNGWKSGAGVVRSTTTNRRPRVVVID